MESNLLVFKDSFYDYFSCFSQITMTWKAPKPTFTNSMFMKKNSPFTRFIAYKITKLAETGITNNLLKRYEISEPNCKPTQVKGQKISKCIFHKVSFPRIEQNENFLVSGRSDTMKGSFLKSSDIQRDKSKHRKVGITFLVLRYLLCCIFNHLIDGNTLQASKTNY